MWWRFQQNLIFGRRLAGIFNMCWPFRRKFLEPPGVSLHVVAFWGEALSPWFFGECFEKKVAYFWVAVSRGVAPLYAGALDQVYMSYHDQVPPDQVEGGGGPGAAFGTVVSHAVAPPFEVVLGLVCESHPDPAPPAHGG